MKSSETKVHYALLVAGTVTGLIGVFWVSTLPARFAEIGSVETEVVSEDDSKSFSDLFSDTKAQLGNIIEGVTPEETLPPDQTNNMDSLNMDDFTIEPDGEAEPASTREPVPSKPVVTKEVPDSGGGPKVILIATSTSQKSE